MRGITILVAAMLLSVAVFAAISNAYTGQTTRVSVNTASDAASGPILNGAVANGVLSADGHFVVFQSSATNLVTGVSGTQVYRHDRMTGTTVLVSYTKTGGPGVLPSRDPTISGDGRYVAFSSFNSDLADGDTNGSLMDVFVRDMQTATTRLVSASSGGAVGNAGSGLNGLAGARQISDDGRYVAFVSLATNLVPETNNGVAQVYVKDMVTLALVRASVNNDGVAGDRGAVTPSISGDGHQVAFTSASTNFSTDSVSGIRQEVFVRNLLTGVTTLESLGTALVTRNAFVPVLSFNGNYLAYVAEAPLDPLDLDGVVPDVYLRDRVAGTTVLASRSPNTIGGDSLSPSISGDGRWVAFTSADELMVAGDTNLKILDVFLYDRDSHNVTIVSRNDAGDQATTASFGASLSYDGHLVLFASTAPNLVTKSSAGNQLYVRNLVSNQAPVVNSGGDETVNEGTWLKRVGTFTDLDGSTSWTGTANYGTGSVPLIIDPVQKLWLFQVEPFAPGTYVVTISITDNEGATGTATFRHTVANVPPTIVGLGGDVTIYFGATLHREVTLGDPGMGWPVPQPAETYSATVNYGDGTGTTALSGVSFTLDHTYASPRTYVVTFTAADSNGGTSSAFLTVHVLNYTFEWLDPVGDMFVVGRNLPVKFTVHAPDGSFILDQSVHVAVYDSNGSGFVEYYFGDQPSRSVTASGGSYHVNVDTRDLAPGTYVLRVTFTSPTLTGTFDLTTNGTAGATTRSGLR